MTHHKLDKKPIYQQLVSIIKAGFSALDPDIQTEIKNFITSQQHKKGAFTDRAGQADLYYSLFGFWLSLATEQEEEISKLKTYVESLSIDSSISLIDEWSLLLLKSELDPQYQVPSVFSIARKTIKKGKTIHLSYQFFLIALVIDATQKYKKLFFFFARIFLHFYNPKDHISCSLAAALLYARSFIGLKTGKHKDQLKHFHINDSGFMAFKTTYRADSLSTAVALFALKETNNDLRMIKHGCLQFIIENYTEGAFLSGDGDKTKDLEYTFYGLLAIGSLLNNEQ